MATPVSSQELSMPSTGLGAGGFELVMSITLYFAAHPRPSGPVYQVERPCPASKSARTSHSKSPCAASSAPARSHAPQAPVLIQVASPAVFQPVLPCGAPAFCVCVDTVWKPGHERTEATHHR